MKRLMDWIAGKCGYVPYWPSADYELLQIRHAYLRQAYTRAYDALHAIIAQDTPNGNATVKRMVKIARDGLGGA